MGPRTRKVFFERVSLKKNRTCQVASCLVAWFPRKPQVLRVKSKKMNQTGLQKPRLISREARNLQIASNNPSHYSNYYSCCGYARGSTMLSFWLKGV